MMITFLIILTYSFLNVGILVLLAQLLAQQCLYDWYMVTIYYIWAIYIGFSMSQSKLHCTTVGDEAADVTSSLRVTFIIHHVNEIKAWLTNCTPSR